MVQIETKTLSGQTILSCVEVSAKVVRLDSRKFIVYGIRWYKYNRWIRYFSKKQKEKLSMFGCTLSLGQIVLVTNILCDPSFCTSIRVDSLQSGAKCKMQLCLEPDFRTALCSATEALPNTGRIFVYDCTNIIKYLVLCSKEIKEIFSNELVKCPTPGSGHPNGWTLHQSLTGHLIHKVFGSPLFWRSPARGTSHC